MKSYLEAQNLKREFLSITGTWLSVSLILALLFVHVTHLADANPPLLTPWPLLSALSLVLVIMALPFYKTLYHKWRNREILLQLHKQLHKHYGGNVPQVSYLCTNMPLDSTIEQAIEAKRQYYQSHLGEDYARRDILTTLELTSSISRNF